MSLEERTYIGAIEPLPDGQIQVREDTVILKNGEIIGKTHHRYVLVPGVDVSARDPVVRAIADTLWTTEVVNNYKNSQEKSVGIENDK